MVNWKFWKKGDSDGAASGTSGSKDTSYVLKRIDGGKQVKVATLADPTPVEDLYEFLEPGVYVLHMYKKGKSGFETVWGPVELTGDSTSKEPSKKKGKDEKVEKSAMVQMVEWAHALAVLKNQASEEFAAIAPFFGYAQAGGGGVVQKTLVQQISEAKEEFNALQSLFGDRTTAAEPLKYKGEIPIWLHPDLVPGLIDSSMSRIETRLTRWGIIGSGKGTAGEGLAANAELPKFPDKPKQAELPEPSKVIKIDEEPKLDEKSNDEDKKKDEKKE